MTTDPTSLLRAIMGEWAGTKADGPGAALRGMVDQGLAAANIPSRGELERIEARLDAIEQALFRIQAQLDDKKARKSKKTGKRADD